MVNKIHGGFCFIAMFLEWKLDLRTAWMYFLL